MADALSDFQRAGILTQENIELVVNHTNLTELTFILLRLEQARILTQENFNALMHPEHALLYEMHDAWDLFPNDLITQANLERLLTAVAHINLEELGHEVNEIAEIWLVKELLDLDRPAQHFNNAQCTNTRSVHRSVS